MFSCESCTDGVALRLLWNVKSLKPRTRAPVFLTAALSAAFIPGASPPVVAIPITSKSSARSRFKRYLHGCLLSATQPFSVEKIRRACEMTAMPESLLKKLLENAVKIEELSYFLYAKACEKVTFHSAKVLLRELAQTELGHKEKLLAIMQGKADISQLGSPTGGIEDLKIVDFKEKPALSDDADYPTLLLFAAQQEKETYEHYRSLAAGPFAHYFPTAGQLFSRLAEEELIHKNRLEREYDECVLKED
jgi:rubrerythrin